MSKFDSFDPFGVNFYPQIYPEISTLPLAVLYERFKGHLIDSSRRVWGDHKN